MEGQTIEAAAAAAGMSERTARKWQRGALPSETKQSRTWRTRPDPFVEVWATEIEPLLIADEEGNLEAKTIFAALCRKKPGAFDILQPFGALRILLFFEHIIQICCQGLQLLDAF